MRSSGVPVRGLLIGLISLLVVVLGGSALVFLLPFWIVPPTPHVSATQLEALRAPIRATAAQVAATAVQLLGIGSLAAGAIYTARTYNLGRAGQYAERLAKAAEQLGEAPEEVRIGSLLNLERLAQDRPESSPTVTALVSAFVRRTSKKTDSGPPEREDQGGQVLRRSDAIAPESLPSDVQVALRILGKRPEAGSETGEDRLDLRSVDLPWARLHGVHFEDAILDRANIARADLGEGVLVRARLRNANLDGAWARAVNLEGAKVVGASARAIELADANLNASQWSRTDLTGAVLTNASCIGTDFGTADLTGANLAGCRLDGANLSNTSGLTENQWNAATTDEKSERPPHWAAPENSTLDR